MLNTKKVRSFGIIEAMIASVIIILILTGAVALTSNLIKGASVDASYQEAEAVSDEVFSGIEAARAAEQLEFVAGPVGGKYPIDCFDNNYINDASGSNPARADCFNATGEYKNFLPFLTLSDTKTYNTDQFDSTGYFTVSQRRSPLLPAGFFAFDVNVLPGATSGCMSIGAAPNAVTVPDQRCRKVVVTVKWQDKNGSQSYVAVERFNDW